MNSPAIPSNQALRDVVVRAVPIELCQLLKFSGLAASGGEAKQLVAERRVHVNGVIETQKRKQLREGDRVEFGGKTIVVRCQR
jgi:ribosome-associated protein